MEEKKIYIKNERFMEFIDELATEMTEMTYGVSAFDDSDSETVELAQDFYSEKYDEIESMANKMILLHSDNDLNK
tara:strand:- start:7125 stop:7349 length:225 start_codon:yes stop_codon:yes gene_type:complete